MESGAFRFSILSYNVNFGCASVKSGLQHPITQKIVQAISDSDADVACLQETTPAWKQVLSPLLSMRYPYSVFHHEYGT
jgi:endonuclease/exonuclease/phosphatase family metal-dependent hydrolase